MSSTAGLECSGTTRTTVAWSRYNARDSAATATRTGTGVPVPGEKAATSPRRARDTPDWDVSARAASTQKDAPGRVALYRASQRPEISADCLSKSPD